MKKRSIHFRLLLATVLLISTTTIGLSYMGISIINDFVKIRFEKRIQFLARYLALNAELGILINERSILDELSRNLLAEKDIVEVAILDIYDQILAQAGKARQGSFTVLETPVISKAPDEETLAFLGTKGVDERIGTIKLTYSTAKISKLQKKMTIRFSLLAIGFTLAAVLIFYFLSHSIVAPVRRLARSARKVAAGNLEIRVVPGHIKETRELSMAFNAMLDSIKAGRAALENAHMTMVRQATLAKQGEFSLMVAHEVKNPLSIIKSSLDILKKDIEGLHDNILVQYIEDEIKRLNHLIEDFLLFAKPMTPNLQQVELNAFLIETINRFELMFMDQSARLNIQTQIPRDFCNAMIDPDLLSRAIGNILKNAAQANAMQGVIRVSAHYTPEKWTMVVKDQGEGLDSKFISKIFDPFFTKRSKGTGLGLAFAQQVLKAMHGQIIAENDTSGAVFKIELFLTKGIS